MDIQLIERLERIGSVFEPKTPSGSSDGIFKSIFDESVANVIESDFAVAADARDLATGESDDLHTLGIDQTKAQLSISLLTQMRNRFMDSYNELMRINL